ncbi:hypothetical protein [Sphingosinicella humi]|uniref:Uncharacterized protein n=1 Tax=Allosphingosinicella humi TaxID=2068657 RepID=A0A2U2J5B9_9SPHN|nr:hypothetical protein [Sphingosinicella humi]PWG03529.1 hypothetical protein DF286_12080 [Sphingosinicella humi]
MSVAGARDAGVNALAMPPEQALLELTILNAEAHDHRFEEIMIPLLDRGVPPEVLTRLSELWEHTKAVAGEIVAVGKIIVRAVVDFLIANPKLTIGLALGAALASLIASIPFLGPILAPLSTWMSVAYGGAVGALMDAGDYSGAIYPAAITLASKFFELLAAIFNGVQAYWMA